jgi:hypothetical protein
MGRFGGEAFDIPSFGGIFVHTERPTREAKEGGNRGNEEVTDLSLNREQSARNPREAHTERCRSGRLLAFL